MKKTLALIIALAMVLGTMSGIAFADAQGGSYINGVYLGGSYEKAYLCVEVYNFDLTGVFTAKCYSNGELVAEATLNEGMLSAGHKDVIGCCFGFDGDYDEYWKTTWYAQPNTAQLPDKIEVYVGGEKIAEKNGPYGNGIKGWDPATNSNALYELIEEDYMKIKGVSGVAKIGNTEYATLQAAIEAVTEGDTITVLRDFAFSKGANGSTNGISYTAGANFTLDLNGKTVASDVGGNALRFKIGEGNSVTNADVKITIKNGKVVSKSNNWCAISASTADNTGNKITLNLENLEVEASKAGDYAIKAWANSVINAKNVDVAGSMAGCFYAVGGEMNLTDCTAVQKGLHTAPYMSMALGVSSGGKLTINSGTYSAEPKSAADGYNQGTTHGSWVGGVMSSGGTLVINGGEFANGNYGDDALATNPRGLIFADKAGVLEVNGGVFNAIGCILDLQNNEGTLPNPKATVTGGTFSFDPRVSATSYNSKLIAIADGRAILETAGGYYQVIEENRVVDKIAVEFVKASEAEGEIIYNINLTADGKIINRLNSVDLDFLFTQANGKNDFEIIASNEEVAINPVDNSKYRYEFHYNGKTDVESDTAATITIGQVKFTGYGKFSFAVNTGKDTNAAHATKTFDNIVDTFIPGGATEGKGELDISDDTITDVIIAVPTRALTINVAFPNAVENKEIAYQDMKVVISGGDLTKAIEIDLGSDAVATDLEIFGKEDAKYVATFANDAYKVIVTDVLTVNNAYTVTVSGAGYRTARYTVTMTDSKELNFWNNVMDEKKAVEPGKASSEVTKNFLAGDIVKDNQINIYDLSAVVSYFASTSDVANGYAKYDLNRDGVIDSKDVAYVLVSWGE